MEAWRKELYANELYHAGIKGQKWGVRRFQYDDGSLTPEGRRRYSEGGSGRSSSGPPQYYGAKEYQSTKKRAFASSLSSGSTRPETQGGFGSAQERLNRAHQSGNVENSGVFYRTKVVAPYPVKAHDGTGRTLYSSPETRYSVGVNPKLKAGRNNPYGMSVDSRKAYALVNNPSHDAQGSNIAKIRAFNRSQQNREHEEYLRDLEEANKPAIQKFVENMSESASQAWDSVKKKASETYDQVSGFVSRTANTVVDAASSAFSSAVSAGKSLIDKIFH